MVRKTWNMINKHKLQKEGVKCKTLKKFRSIEPPFDIMVI